MLRHLRNVSEQGMSLLESSMSDQRAEDPQASRDASKSETQETNDFD